MVSLQPESLVLATFCWNIVVN